MTIQKAIKIIETACSQWSLGYDQFNRLDFRDGGETDCSALVIITCQRAGLLPGNDIRKNIGATYTGNMAHYFGHSGWQVHGNMGVDQLHLGDVLLNDSHHTAMYVGNHHIAVARIDERGRAHGGALGNQTGRETLVERYYDYPWLHVLRFHGTAHPATPAPPAVIGKASAKKLQAILGLQQTGVIDKGTFKALQSHVGAPFHDGVASNQNSAAIAAHWPALAHETFTVGDGNSPSVKSLQARIGVEQTGELDEITARAFQKRLNTGQL